MVKSMEEYFRKQSKSNDACIVFQPLYYEVFDYIQDDTNLPAVVYHIFGCAENGDSVCLSVENFELTLYFEAGDKTFGRSAMGMANSLDRVNKKLLKNAEYVLKKSFYGYSDKPSKFVKLTFDSIKGLKQYSYAVKRHYQIYNTNIDPIITFIQATGISPSSWIRAKKTSAEVQETSTCVLNYRCDWANICPETEPRLANINAPMLQASFDIETYSSPVVNHDGKEYYPFPVPEKKGNVVYQIATCFKRIGSDDEIHHLATLKKFKREPDDTLIVDEYATEADLIIGWSQMISKMDPDILYTYNGDIFDCVYLYKRASLLHVLGDFVNNLSRMYEYVSEIKDCTFGSSAYGTTNYKRLVIPGRFNFDILIYIRREFKENSYKLDSIAEKYLKMNKHEVTPIDIFKAYESGDPVQIAVIGRYCLTDTRLPQLLVEKLAILQSLLAMSNVCYVPVKYLIERGQTVKVMSQIFRITEKRDMVIPHFAYGESVGDESFQGATVLIPDVGSYLDEVVTVLDFASLYPSIIQAHNFCFSTLDSKGILPDEDCTILNVDGVTARFYQKEMGVMPELLYFLGAERKKYKTLMAQEEDPFIKEIYNKTQTAYKVSMNSVYGFSGSKTFKTKIIAACVTQTGREMILATKEFIHDEPKIILADGTLVTGKLSESDQVYFRSVGSSDESGIAVEFGKLAVSNDYEIKTDRGWLAPWSCKEVVIKKAKATKTTKSKD